MTATPDFKRFGRTSSLRPATDPDRKVAVIYTRVSSKEQADTNLSLDTQRKTVEDYAARAGFTITERFGGTYESAKTDGRKEFNRMLQFVKQSRGKITHILVYALDRFSRSGGGAIELTRDLREKYGVTVFAVTQPTDTSNASGVFQQSIQFLFSQYDNQLRKMRAIAGIKEKLNLGIWCITPPMGYDVVKVNNVRSLVVNNVGKKLRKAFQWKAKGEKNEAIIVKLQALGVPMYKQKLSQIFENPFYCGMICHKLLDGKVLDGTHEKLISQGLFMMINDIRQVKGGKYGISHQKEREELPLKTFIHCDTCERAFTGYVVQKKGLWYYKCPTNGCKCNKSAKTVNTAFVSLLETYRLQEHLVPVVHTLVGQRLKDQHAAAVEDRATLKTRLSEMQETIETLEERYFVKAEMSRETYDRLAGKLAKQREEIETQIAKAPVNSSNHETTLKKQSKYR